MGLGNNSGSANFITIVHGKWTLRVPEGTEGASSRVLEKGPNAGTAINELYFDYIDGELVGGEFKTGQYGTDLCLNLRDDKDYTVQIPLESGFFSNFAKACPNIDPTQKLFLGLGKDKEKDRFFLYLKQGGDTVHSAFTKDNPNGMPPPVKKSVKGVEKWDFEDQENFLYDQVVDFLAAIGGAEKVLADAGFEPSDNDPF